MDSSHGLAHLVLLLAVAMTTSGVVGEHVIVVGGGLAGLSAAIEAVQSGRANVSVCVPRMGNRMCITGDTT